MRDKVVAIHIVGETRLLSHAYRKRLGCCIIRSERDRYAAPSRERDNVQITREGSETRYCRRNRNKDRDKAAS